MTTRQGIIDEAKRLVDTLEARGKTHGEADSNFIVSADLLNAFGFRKCSPNALGTPTPLDKHDVTVVYRLLKLARIATGDRMEPDHSLDEAGYSIIDAAMVRSNITGAIVNPRIHPQMTPDDRSMPIAGASYPQTKP